jgi:hypothetical protein
MAQSFWSTEPMAELRPNDDEKAGMAWWNALTEQERADWLRIADTAVPAVAWAVWQQRQRRGENDA